MLKLTSKGSACVVPIRTKFTGKIAYVLSVSLGSRDVWGLYFVFLKNEVLFLLDEPRN